MFNLFKKKKAPTLNQPRDFSIVPWTWGRDPTLPEKFPKYHIWKFANGLGVIVYERTMETFDGMMYDVFDDIKIENGNFLLKKPNQSQIGRFYVHGEGLGIEEVQNIINQVRNL